MFDKTREKILDVALKIFAEKGYKGATTREIAAVANFNDSTLFRKFETKENLFHEVLIQNNENVMKDLDLMLIDKDFESPEEFLETLIRNLVELAENNYELFNLNINEGSRISGTIMDKFIMHISKYMEKNVPDTKLNIPIFVMTITSFIYLLIHDKHQGNNAVNHEEAVEIFIKNMIMCF